ncbi:MAG: hypothetical protein IJ232_02325 [Lachnospiraceae bacterium]|nr:hypothetical protein [Lachnospiraceae bacterium]
MVFDVHTCTELDAWGDNKLFVVYLKNLTDENGKIVREIDYTKVKYIFDDGKTLGELWNWLDHDFAGYDGLIYSIPNYKTAMADVYRYVAKSHDYKFEIHEEKVPHDYDGSYKVTLMYDGKVIGTQTRSCPACINKAIKLFRDTKGEEYLDDYTKDEVAFRGKHSSWGPIEAWQIDTFNYFGCQNGTILQNSIVRYYYGYRPYVSETAKNGKYLPEYNSIYGYCVRYKQFGGCTVQPPADVMHVSGALIDTQDKAGKTIKNSLIGGTGSFDGENKTDMPYYDYLLPINEKYNKQNTYKAWQQEPYPLYPVEN